MTAIDARRALLAELFDDAGLFPPAELPMEQAVAQHQRSRTGPYAWMMGRFVCPASRLAELTNCASGRVERMSVILAGPDAAEATAVFARTADWARIEQMEILLPPGDPKPAVETAVRVAKATAVEAPLFIEVPAGDADAVAVVAAVAAVAARGDRVAVKIRCGGARIPDVGDVARTIVACRDAGVRLKATAGLHRAYALGDRFGFLSLLGAAAGALVAGFDQARVAQALRADGPSGVRLTAEGLSIGAVTIDAAGCALVRASLFAGIGSCSFDEPVEDLESLGVLPE